VIFAKRTIGGTSEKAKANVSETTTDNITKSSSRIPQAIFHRKVKIMLSALLTKPNMMDAKISFFVSVSFHSVLYKAMPSIRQNEPTRVSIEYVN